MRSATLILAALASCAMGQVTKTTTVTHANTVTVTRVLPSTTQTSTFITTTSISSTTTVCNTTSTSITSSSPSVYPTLYFANTTSAQPTYIAPVVTPVSVLPPVVTPAAPAAASPVQQTFPANSAAGTSISMSLGSAALLGSVVWGLVC